jgi:hypothetical protein
MSVRSDYERQLADGYDVSAHPGRPSDDAGPALRVPARQVINVVCTTCRAEEYRDPDSEGRVHCAPWSRWVRRAHGGR